MLWYVPSILAVAVAGLLIALLLRREDHSASTAALAVALGGSALLEIVDLAAIVDPGRGMLFRRFSFAAEALIPAAWLAHSLTFARTRTEALTPRRVLSVSAIVLSAVLFISPENLVFSPDFAAERLLFVYPSGYLFYCAAVMALVTALIQLERTLFALPAPHRWKVKFELMGAGAVLSMLLIYDGQALLYGIVDMNLVPARGASVVAGGALIAYSRLRRGGKVAVRISRQLAFRSAVLFLLGGYLVALGLLEEGVRHFGEGFERAVVWIVGLGGGVALVACLLSERYQRKLRVLIHKHFYKSKYDYRRQWLACTERIASARTEGELQKTILSLFCETFAVKGAALYLRDAESGDFHPCAFHEADVAVVPLPRDGALVQALGGREWILNLRESVPETGGELSAFFAVPLVFDRTLEGIILLQSPIDPAEAYIYEDFDLMKTLARQAVSTILNLRLADQLVETREMAAVGRISAYLLHDLKNHVSSLAMVVDNAERHLENPEFRRDMLGTLGNSVQKMRRLVARLKNLEEKEHLRLEPCDLLEVARESAALVQGEVRVAGGGATALVDREEMGKVLLNLLVNALEAGGAPVEVEAGSDGEGPFLRVGDRGCGMSEEFVRRHLFRPFRTTKTGGFGIGLYQCRSIVEAHKGSIRVETEPGAGTRFTLRFPSPGTTGAGDPMPESAQGHRPHPKPSPLAGSLGGTCSTCS